MAIQKIVDAVKSGKTSATDIVQEAIQKAESVSAKNALISLTKDRAIERAKNIDKVVADGGDPGVLAGVPFVVKDNFLVFGAPTTAAAKMLEGFQAPVQATSVEKLEATGAICIGKSNLDAFAHGGSTENSYFGATKNAIDDSRVAGGSSGGSAVITALDVVPFALGSDTGGSIRQPASYNGVYGMKPTYGAVSRFGVVAMASSTDTIGCFTRDAEDCDLVMRVMAGRDRRDMTTLKDFYDDETAELKSLKIGIIKESMSDDVDLSVRQAIEQVADRLRGLGHAVDEVSLPMSRYALAAYYIIMPAEVSSNLARYDGIRYGHRSDSARDLVELYGKSRDEGFMTENKRRIMIGSYVLSSGYYDAYYRKAQQARTLLIQEFEKLFTEYDLLLSPTTPDVAFRLGANADDPVKMYMTDIMTVPASLAGLPALSVPVGVDKDGLPIGAQIIGPQRSDQQIIALASSLEAER